MNLILSQNNHHPCWMGVILSQSNPHPRWMAVALSQSDPHPRWMTVALSQSKALLSLHLNSLAEIQQTVLSWGKEAYVQQPPETRQFLYEVGKQFVEWYGPGQKEVPSSKIQVSTEGEGCGAGEMWCPDI